MDRQQQAIEQLREAIENEVGRKMKTPKDFDYLSEAIGRQLHEHISSTTLKRMWGYLAEPVTPRISTLDILAQFLGHADWDAFCKSLPDESSVSTATVPDKKPLFRRHPVLLAAPVSVLILGVLIWLLIPSKSPENEPITFADEQVKALCIANWDTNGDGELSYAEAAAVTELGEVFKSNTEITSFDELQYFTGVTSIWESSFGNCTGLTSIELPNSLVSIRDYAFERCEGLLSLTIPSSVTYIGHFGSNAALMKITVDENNPVYDSRNNCNAIIETATNALVKGCKGTVIPNDVTSISGFAGNFGMESILIPSSVKSIAPYAFAYCLSLHTVMSQMTTPCEFGENAFLSIPSDCTLLIPNGTRDAYIAAGWTEELFKGGVIESPKM